MGKNKKVEGKESIHTAGGTVGT